MVLLYFVDVIQISTYINIIVSKIILKININTMII